MAQISNPFGIPFYNGRVKLYPDENGEYTRIAECCVFSKAIFNPTHAEISGNKKTAAFKQLPAEYDDIEDLVGSSIANIERARRRAYNRVKDLIACNEWKFFITLTLDASKIDRTDPQAAIKRLGVGSRTGYNVTA